MTRTSTWLILFAALVIGIFGLFMAAHGTGMVAMVGWIDIAVAVLLGAAMVRRLADQAFDQH